MKTRFSHFNLSPKPPKSTSFSSNMSPLAIALTTLSPLTSLPPYHLLLYSTLLGTQLYQVHSPLPSPPTHSSAPPNHPLQTFIMTSLSYRALPKSAFTTLQKHVFPTYFRLQTALLLLTAATHPPHGAISLAVSPRDLLPLAIGAATALPNLLVYGPRTQEAMVQRVHQGNAPLCRGD